ncbi:glycosyltransferase [Shewanella sp. A25]|nr:glycosyltransferase [Shewanella shenzhenensis]
MNIEWAQNYNFIDDIDLSFPVEFKTAQKVSVVIPFNNSTAQLKTALIALKNQTLSENEIIIVNDSGTNPLNVSAELYNISLFYFCNQGAYGARNYGLKQSTGDFITVHDADDWSHPQKLELQVKALIDNPKAVASVSHWARCTNDMQFETRPDGTVVHRNISSLMIRREVFERLGYWDRVSVNADTEYYYRILAAYGPDSIVEVMPGVPLALGRRHDASLTMQPETHWQTQFGGVRKDYMDAAHAWHKECAKSGNWYMPYAPKQRLFPVPALIDRAVLELGDRVWPHIAGLKQVSDKAKPCVLLCGHAGGAQQFGAERSLLDLAKAISSLGHRLIISLPERNMAYIEQLTPWCSDIVLLPSPWNHADEAWPIAMDAYCQLIDHFEIGLVHVNTLVNRTPLLAAQKSGVKSVLHIRELLNWDSALQQAMGESGKMAEDYDPLLLADKLIANSAYTARSLSFDRPELTGKLSVVTNTVTLDGQWTAAMVQQGKTIRIGMVSSNLPKKGLDDFMALALEVAKRQLPLTFVLIGPSNEFTSYYESNPPQNVVFAGYSDSPEQALSQLDVLLNLSSFQESFGRTVAEAMLAAKPVIAYRWGALPKLVTNGVTGFLVHLGDIEGVLARLELFCNKPELMTQFGNSAQKIAVEYFNQTRFKQELTNAYRDLQDQAL